jgi:hypothetical protein
MALRRPETEEISERHTLATEKVRLWESRADKARKEGRISDADRCADKVRDWVSKARQLERIGHAAETSRANGGHKRGY